MTGIDLLRLKGEEAHHLVTYSLNGVVLFLGITGALAKFALDANSTPPLRSILTCFGLAICVLGFFCCWLAARVRRAIETDLMALSQEYALPFLPSALIAAKFIVVISLIFAAFTTAAWIWILAAS